MKRFKLLMMYLKLKIKRYDKEHRYFKYAIEGLITFEQYEKYIDNKIMKKGDKYYGQNEIK